MAAARILYFVCGFKTITNEPLELGVWGAVGWYRSEHAPQSECTVPEGKSDSFTGDWVDELAVTALQALDV